MRHPTDGTLRRLLDEPAGVTDADREHVARCPECLSELATAHQDAALTGAALRAGTAPDVDAGWSRLSKAVAADDRRPQPAVALTPQRSTEVASGRRRFTARGPRWRTALRKPVIAGFAVVAMLTGASAAAAADWLQVFRTERVAPVTFTQADLVALPDLSGYGELTVTHEPDVREVADATAAEKATGLPVPRLENLPRGVTGQPVLRVGDRMNAEFTFSVEKAAAAAAAGETLPPAPAGLDGSTFRLSAGPGVAAVWSEARGVPAMIVARAVAPTAYSAGIPFETARDYVLSLPGLPTSVASQLRTFSGDGTTLPLPVRSEFLSSSTAHIGGKPATVLTSRDGLLAGVVWADNGVITAVAGSLSTDEVLSVARELRRR